MSSLSNPLGQGWQRNRNDRPAGRRGEPVFDALWHLGIRNVELPLTPESIFRTMQQAIRDTLGPTTGGAALPCSLAGQHLVAFSQIARRRLAKRLFEHRDEGADRLVAEILRDRLHRFSRG